MLSLFSIISLASAETVASSNCTCTECWPSVPQASIASKGVQSGLGEPEMSDTAGNTAMSFWTSTAEEDAAAVAATLEEHTARRILALWEKMLLCR